MNNIGLISNGHEPSAQAMVADVSGGKISEVRYFPWGTTRYTSGTSPTIPRLRSGQAFQYTGQRVESSLGLLFYNARCSPGRASGTPRPGGGAVRAGNIDVVFHEERIAHKRRSGNCSSG